MKKKSAKTTAVKTTEPPAASPPAFRTGLILTLALTAFFCLLIFFNIIIKLDTFHWDEAHHAFYGLQLAQSVQQGNLEGFWNWTDRQALWPFAHSWFLTIFFLLFGLSENVARGLSLVIYGLTALLLYLTANRLFRTEGWQIGLLAVLFFLTAPLTLSFASQNMLEGLGALEFLLAVYLYFLAEDRGNPGWFLAAGAVLALSLVTKYNYALLIVSPFGAYLLFDFWAGARKNIKNWLIKGGALFGPLAATALLWFLSGDSARKVQMIFFSQNVSTKQDIMPSLWSNLGFYPDVIVHDYFFSPWLGWLALAALCLPLAAKKVPRTVLLYLSVWASFFLLLTVIGTKMNRLFYPAAPLVYLLLAAGLFYLFTFVRERFNLAKNTAALLLLILLLPSLVSLPRLGKMLIGGDITDIKHGIKISAPAARFSNVLSFFHDNLPRDRSAASGLSGGLVSPYVQYFYFRDWQAPFYTVFQANEPGFGRADFLLTLEQTGTPQPDKIDQEALGRWNAYVDHQVKSGFYYSFKEQAWPELGVTAKILAKRDLNLLHKTGN